MQLNGQHFSQETITAIQSTVDAEPEISRRALSRRVCGWLDWRSPNGKLNEAGCRKALLTLHRRGLVHLPEATIPSGLQRLRRSEIAEPPELPDVSGSLEDIGTVSIEPVGDRRSRTAKTWKSMMEHYHYLSSGPLCGGQIRYAVRSSEYGWLGGAAFSGAVWATAARDQHIGWSEAARRANLPLVVNNSRLLILPTVRVANLASYILSRCLKRLADDWLTYYGYTPVLAETFVDPSRFRGTCYRAANWHHVGRTRARRNAFANGKVPDGPKDIYLRPIHRQWKARLCREPSVPLCSTPRPESPSDWAEEEFGTVQFYDQRLTKRLTDLARDFFAQPGSLIPEACDGSKAKIKAAYRFFDNSAVTMDTLLRPHVESTIERIKRHQVVLAAQDTTTLNYSPHAPADAGPINNSKDRARGLLMHDTMAFTTEGTPLGLLDVQCWARDPKIKRKKDQRNDLPIEQKESVKWLNSFRAVGEAQPLCPHTMLVSVGDREADLYELFHDACDDPDSPELLVRAERTRKRKTEQQHLWQKMAAEPAAGKKQVHISSKGGQPARNATLQVHFSQVRMIAPQGSALPDVTVWAVYAHEIDYPAEVKKPIDWMLLTTVPTDSFEAACERMDWYSQRWGIEVYHRTLKSGCRIQDRRLDNTDGRKACLAVDMVVAWRVYRLTKAGRETPHFSCEEFLKQEEWQALAAWHTGSAPPENPPDIQQASRWIGKLGGWIGRKGDGEPGTTCMWRGLIKLAWLAEGTKLAGGTNPIRAGPL